MLVEDARRSLAHIGGRVGLTAPAACRRPRSARSRGTLGVTPAAPAHPSRAVAPSRAAHPSRAGAPQPRRRTPAAPAHPSRAGAPQPRCRTPAALSHPSRAVAPQPCGRPSGCHTPAALSHPGSCRRTCWEGCDGCRRCAPPSNQCAVGADRAVAPQPRCRTPSAPAHPSRAVAPQPRRRTPAAPAHPSPAADPAAVTPQPRCRTPGRAGAHVGRGVTVAGGARRPATSVRSALTAPSHPSRAVAPCPRRRIGRAAAPREPGRG